MWLNARYYLLACNSRGELYSSYSDLHLVDIKMEDHKNAANEHANSDILNVHCVPIERMKEQERPMNRYLRQIEINVDERAQECRIKR